MKNKMKKFGLIIFRTDREAEFHKKFNETWDKMRKGSILNGRQYVGHGAPIGADVKIPNIPAGLQKDRKFRLYQISANCFRTYKDFDTFLIELARVFYDLDDIALVLGHNDDDGFFWMDYYMSYLNGETCNF